MINVLDAWRAKRRIHNTRQKLNTLSDQILADIGLTRDDIHRLGRNGQFSRQDF